MDVTEILEAHSAQFKPITVEKLVPLDFDLNLLAGFDTNALEEKTLKSKNNMEKYLTELTRDNAQLIVNELFKLPVTSADAGVLAQLPNRVSVLPREKPLPKDKPLTRWEKFAKAKGIQNKKRERMVYDEETGEYVPRWGYKPKEEGKLDADWLMPVPNHADPMEDQYEKAREAKKARVEKNTKRQRRNQEEGAAASLAGKKDIKEFKKDELQTAIAASKKSTASLGKFDAKLKGETKMKGVTHQFSPTIGDVKAEKNSSLDILKKIVGKNDIVNTEKAARLQAKREHAANFEARKKPGSDKKKRHEKKQRGGKK
ncbi:ribosome biogenesis regulatory protein-domain-containing protein [Gilbertella persicaria]|uniref:ribosome biogenesis regulatory protein-domain-containing protein n=1 Tax=Gilbertella persicaria TaxID=101096 RepID=UPI00222030E3|nr:ribosome biogenesis regulatory protein-domain-containing protein [Gilbertella persicaria]KAI8061469.1 ribosome biogenesis regulatory protein-domain-containing protein [Gilbertella persicaria]